MNNIKIVHLHNHSDVYHLSRQILLNSSLQNPDCFFYHILSLDFVNFNKIYPFACIMEKNLVEADLYTNVDSQTLNYIIEYLQTGKINTSMTEKIVDLAKIFNMPKLIKEFKPKETDEERKLRAFEILQKLSKLAETNGIILSKNYTLDDDPDQMQYEYDLHMRQIKKKTDVRYYKQMFLNIVFGLEFLNNKYNLLNLKLDNWASDVANDLDITTEFFEKIYDKYNMGETKEMPPEVNFLLFLITSALKSHLGQSTVNQVNLETVLKSHLG